MSDQFTTQDWRPGKRRVTTPRKQFYGGQKVAPVAFLVASKPYQFGSGAQRRCEAIARSTGQRCTQPAMRTVRFCRCHTGAATLAKRGQYVKPRKPST